MFKILVLNLGSTSTKTAIFHDEQMIDSVTLRHSSQDLSVFPNVMDQIGFRKSAVETWLREKGVDVLDFSIFCVRGGLIKPIPCGIYKIDHEMIKELEAEKHGSHVSNAGMAIGYRWGQETGKEVIFVNAPVSDELTEVARMTGFKGIERRSIFHALNQKQIALEYARSLRKAPEDLNLIVCHMGGGITIGAHQKGRIVDVTNAIDGEGPLTPERAGSLDVRMTLQLLKQFNGDEARMNKELVGKGGMVSHLGTNNVLEVVERAKTEPYARLILDVMIYQCAKSIGAMATVLEGQVDQILLTGGLAYNTQICQELIQRIQWISGVSVYPGEDELRALADGALRYLRHEEALKPY